MDPLVGAALVSGGANLIGEVAGGGESELEELQRRFLEMQMNRGTALWDQFQGDLANPGKFLSQQRAAMAPEINKVASSASRRVGLDSSAAQGEIARHTASGLQRGMLDRDRQTRGLLAGLAR